MTALIRDAALRSSPPPPASLSTSFDSRSCPGGSALGAILRPGVHLIADDRDCITGGRPPRLGGAADAFPAKERVMETDKAIFEKLIREDRAARESHNWRGTFLEYLDRVREDSSITKLAHARLYDMIMAPGARDILETDDGAREAALQGRAGPGLQLLRRGVLRHRADGVADRALLPLRRAEGRGEPSGALSDGTGRLGQELAGRAAAARARGAQPGLRDRRLPDAGGAAASAAAPPAARVREDARRAHRGRPLPGVPLPAEGRVRHPLRRGADRACARSRSATASASASCRRSIRTTRTPRC